MTNFYVVDDIYLFFRCAMGLKPIPQIAQRVTDHVVDTIKDTACGFIDDFILYNLCYLTAFDTLRKFLIIASHFNVKLMPQKCKWLRRTQIFLGYRIAHKKLFRIIPSNVKKLRNLKSPNSKKDLKSFLGLLAWFQNRSNIREKSFRLRQMAKANARFKWDNELEQDLRDCIEIILDPVTGCLRPAVVASELCRMCVMTDSSSTSLGAILVQYQYVSEEEAARENLDKSERRLYLIEYYSSYINERDRILPIAILELYSLEKALAHWRHFLYGSYKFLVFTDSAYVSFWVNLRMISERVARSIYYIGTFNFDIYFIPSTLNASDVFSRADLTEGVNVPQGAKSRNIFKQIQIHNSMGEVIPHEKIFSRQLTSLADDYFMAKTKGKLVEAFKVKETIDGMGSDETWNDKSETQLPARNADWNERRSSVIHLSGVADRGHSVPAGVSQTEVFVDGAGPNGGDPTRAGSPPSRTPEDVEDNMTRELDSWVSRRTAARRKRNLRKKTKDGHITNLECQTCSCVGIGTDTDQHCTCCCVEMKTVLHEVNSYRISTEDQMDEQIDMTITDEFESYELPTLEKSELERMKTMQTEDNLVMQCKRWIEGTEPLPNKTETLGLTAETLSILRHLNLFKLSDQGIIFRLFVDSKGKVETLVFLHGYNLERLIWETHESYGHIGINKVMSILKKNFYTTGLRYKCIEVIRKCVTCIKYNPIRPVKEKWSTQMSSSPREMWTLDLAGPWPASGSFKYIAVIRDNFSREAFLRPCKSTSGQDIAKVLLSVFEEEGLPEILIVDGGCLTKNKIDRDVLSKLNIKVRISNNQSRAQSPAERLIQEVTKRLLKLMDEQETLSGWHLLLRKVQFSINVTPSVGEVSPFQLTRRHTMRCLVPGVEPIRPINSTAKDFNLLVKMFESVRLSSMVNLISHKCYKYPTESLSKGQIVFRKRMSFARNINKKLQVKILSGYQVKERVGSGLYKLRNILTNEIAILPVDQLIETNMNENQVRDILTKLIN